MAKKITDKNRVKLLVGIINKEDEAKLCETVNGVCCALHFSGLGHGTAPSSHKSYFGFNEIEKRVTISLIPAELEHSILSAVGNALRLYLLGRGIAFTMPLTGISGLVEQGILSDARKQSEKTAQRGRISKKEKTTMHELVIAVVNRKYTDEAIDAARAAGATGATVFHTKSLQNQMAEHNIGTSIPQETDSVFFLTTSEYKLKIMEAVRDAAGLKTEGGAVIFSMPVDDLVGIGRFDEFTENAE